MTTSTATASDLRLSGVSVGYRDSVVLDGLDLHIRAGEFLVVMGPSGCGKSTLLRTLTGLLAPHSGEVAVGGSAARALVFQDGGLLPWRTAQANVELPMDIQGVPRRRRRQLAGQWLGRVGLAGMERTLPGALSGGMRQRVQLARALAGTPGLLLMDEPFGALDAPSRTAMQRLLLDVWTEEQVTVVFVTHDSAEALALADRVVVLGGSPTRIVADLPVRSANNPDHIGELLAAALEEAAR
ncbi:MAG TPA: ATP-binding cassette domain-containing protein [Pseudonocardiaceae bacterium]|jgi:NitT/TauT family transport system ATP-binding protein|nr:ATP-binding cassette domain-containing protein [Pseudonocardiaceae bacterium]